MVESLHTRLDERLAGSIRRSADEPVCDVVVERFMGVLIHPVPALTMQEITGVFRPGGKVLIEWPDDRSGWANVAAGDSIVVAGHELPIRATFDFPPCYAEIYVDAP